MSRVKCSRRWATNRHHYGRNASPAPIETLATDKTVFVFCSAGGSSDSFTGRMGKIDIVSGFSLSFINGNRFVH